MRGEKGFAPEYEAQKKGNSRAPSTLIYDILHRF
jgi:hypothetical protein